MNEFYEFTASSESNVYAPTILNESRYFANCSECGSNYLKNEIGDVDLIIEGKGKYPDILSCGRWPILIVSDKVLRIWNDNNISGFRSYNVSLFTQEGQEIPKSKGHYHHISITGRSELDFDAMGIRIIARCNTCGRVEYNKESWEFGIPIIKKDSWDGSDLFAFKQFRCTSMCGMKNLKLIYKNKLINFSFHPLKDMFNYSSNEINLKELFA